jgi:protein-export membrane protein SecD
MSLTKRFAKLSLRAKSWWVLGVIVIFVIAVGLAVGGNYYNIGAKKLAAKTNNVIILPLVKELPFSLGLDLQGGTHLVYQADVSGIAPADRDGALAAVRDVIERRVNAFGVAEPLVQVNKGMNGEYRIIAELAGVKNVNDAIKLIGETPILEFKEQGTSTVTVDPKASTTLNLNTAPGWINTELTGKNLKRATLQFDPNDGSPEVSLEFDAAGAKLFEDITARNVGKPVAIFLDGYPISTPTVNEKITGGKASISGKFTVDEAKSLVTRLNSGALPVPISLISQNTVESSLGSKSVDNSMKAGLIGLLLVSIFMILYYRLPGFLSVISLLVYGLTVLAIFKALPIWLSLFMVIIMIALIYYTFTELKIFNGSLALMFAFIGILLFFYAYQPITLSLSGIAGFILSVGMAVDANILIFARTREELKLGKSVNQAVEMGFKRAWPSIRDGNISTLITCLILMFFGTSTVQGFGTTLFIGIAVSLFSAIVVTHTLFVLTLGDWLEKRTWLLGVKRKLNADNK